MNKKLLFILQFTFTQVPLITSVNNLLLAFSPNSGTLSLNQIYADFWYSNMISDCKLLLTLSSCILRSRVTSRMMRELQASRWLSDCSDRKYSSEPTHTLQHHVIMVYRHWFRLCTDHHHVKPITQ